MTSATASPPSATKLAQTLLTALTWAYGSGFPEDEWLTVAAALTHEPVRRPHISWVLDQMGRYIVQDGEGGVAVYRLAHQSLADHLRPPFRPNHRHVFDPDAAPVWTKLAERYREFLLDGHPADQLTYLWRYAGRHAEAAGPIGLDRLRDLAEQDASLRPVLANAQLAIAERLASWNRSDEALPLTKKAADILSELATNNPAYKSDYAKALVAMGKRVDEVGMFPFAATETARAVNILRELARESADYVPDLGAALVALGSASQAPWVWEWIESEGFVRRETLDGHAESNALVVTREAVDIFRQLVSKNASYVADLGNALTHLGLVSRRLGNFEEAIAIQQEALALMRTVAADDPAQLPNLAFTLSQLADSWGEARDPEDARIVYAETISLLRQLAADDEAYIPSLARALVNFSKIYGKVGLSVGLTYLEEAVRLFREVAKDNPAYVRELVSTLVALSEAYSASHRFPEAADSQEAAALLTELAADNPNYLHDWAAALHAAARDHSRSGAPENALSATEWQVAVLRRLAADDSAHWPELAAALIQLGALLNDLGRPEDAVRTAREASELLRRSWWGDRPTVGVSEVFSDAALRFDELGQTETALAAESQAVDILRLTNYRRPTFHEAMALVAALGHMTRLYEQLGRPQDAVSAAREAINALLKSHRLDLRLRDMVGADTGRLTGEGLVLVAAVAAIRGASTTASELVRQAIEREPQQRSAWITLVEGLAAVHPAVLSLLPFLRENWADDGN
jgi:tetratricopeptide (TPR) repeat protein